MLLGYALAEWRRTPVPERSLTQGELCDGRPGALCTLEHRAYSLAQDVGERLAERHCLLVTAESITVGSLAATFGTTRWAGLVLAGGIVAYDTAVKAALLDVPAAPDAAWSDLNEAMVSEAAALDMVNGLHALFEPLNVWREEAGRQRRACAYVALTGAATTWRGKPRLYIALRLGDEPAEVVETALRDDLEGRPEERVTNIQLAVVHALELLQARLAVSEDNGG